MIFITGASGGIGEACAIAFAERGHALLLVARRREKLDALAHALREKFKVSVYAFELDVTKRAEVEAFGLKQRELLQQVTILVNNAGLAKGLSTLQDADPDDWDAMIDTNIKGLLHTTRLVVGHFVAKTSGHIVNLGSIAGHWTYPKGNVYCATKSAVHALSESMRLDLHGSGIRVTEISPGMVATDFSRVRLGDESKAKAVYAGVDALTAADIAETICWAVERPARVNIQEIVLYPTDQASPGLVHRRGNIS